MTDTKTRGGGGIRLHLNTIPNAKRSLARIIRLRAAGQMDRDLFRDLCYGFEKFLGFGKLAEEMQIEQRLAEIEQRLREARHD